MSGQPLVVRSTSAAPHLKQRHEERSVRIVVFFAVTIAVGMIGALLDQDLVFAAAPLAALIAVILMSLAQKPKDSPPPNAQD